VATDTLQTFKMKGSKSRLQRDITYQLPKLPNSETKREMTATTRRRRSRSFKVTVGRNRNPFCDF